MDTENRPIKIKDIVISNGDIINTVKVISDVYYKPVGADSKMRRFFKIQCLKCGELLEASEISLKHSKTGQCRHCRSNAGRMKGNPQNHNSYEFYGDLCIGYTNSGEQFFIDTEDYEKVKDYCWRISAQGYVETTRNKQKFKMHRLLLDAPAGKDVDHKNRIRNYNLKSNLAIVTRAENCQNRGDYKNNTSGKTGVYFHKAENKWRTYIHVNRQRINGTAHETLEAAIMERKALEQQYFTYVASL